MNILFVCRGNKADKISPIIRAQAESLRAEGIIVDIYPIEGYGITGYFKNLISIQRVVRNRKYDIIHSHFGFSSILTTIAFPFRKHVASLMGSELYRTRSMKMICSFMARRVWTETIVKTAEMAELLRSQRVNIIPNGIDLNKYYPVSMSEARRELGIDQSKVILLFPSYPFRKEKNYDFAQKVSAAFENAELIHFNFFPPEKVNLMYNAADVVILPSSFEGSPNVIKEAMACNRPIVATSVGDVRTIIGTTEGCFVSALVKDEFIEMVKTALRFSRLKRGTNGRDRILGLALDSKTVAQRIISLYHKVLANT